eukprot:Nitzschia sp. Nitz4//scaffold138_size62050//1486//1804//NITZ4_006380-RA/size62050-exonerate_est2genome-gene-0.38-mRNA-1//-1//CDS//3329535743//4047//frame0
MGSRVVCVAVGGCARSNSICMLTWAHFLPLHALPKVVGRCCCCCCC